jgi:hypothetical protein
MSSRLSTLKALPRIVGMVVFLSTLLIALHPDARFGAREMLKSHRRSVLSVVENVRFGERSLDVIKVRENGVLAIEVYDKSDGRYRLMGRTEIGDQIDAFFRLSGRASNLFVTDLNADGEMEIAAPSYDRNLVAHLNVFSLRHFEDRVEIVQGP